MKIVTIGLNYKTAPLEIREKLTLTTKDKTKTLELIKNSPQVEEGLILATCNRTEIYLAAENICSAEEFSLQLFQEISGLAIDDLEKHLYKYNGLKVVKHLYQVVSGLDSLVIGEAQILGQVKDAFRKAKELEAVGTYLHQIFTESFRVAKRARSETGINANAASISYVAVELARKIFGSLTGETVLILGAGEMSELTLKSLVDHGVKGVMVANRTYQRALKLADEFSGEAINWEEIEAWVEDVDIIIASTAAPHYVLRYELMDKIMANRKRPLFLIDIAVPRDIEPEIKEISGVHLYNIDDLESVVEENLAQRREEIARVKSIIEQEVNQFKRWLNHRKSTPVIKKVRGQAERIKEEEVAWALKQLENSTDSEEVVKELANRLMNKIMHNPTVGIKKIANIDREMKDLEIVEELFACRNNRQKEQLR